MKDNQSEKHTKKQWDNIYKHEDIPQPVQRGMPEIINIFKKHNAKRVLDLACGSGRHTLYLSKNGFEVFGLDISDCGIKTARHQLQKNNLQANLVVGSIYNKLPYDNDFFNAIICIRSLHHGTIENIRYTIKEIERTLKTGGFIYTTVRKRIAKKKRLPFEEIAPRTYIPLEGDEKGTAHYLFNKKLFRKEFKNFKVHQLRIDYGPKNWEAYYCLLGQLN